MVEGVNCDQRYLVEPAAVIDLCDISAKKVVGVYFHNPTKFCGVNKCYCYKK